MMTANDKYAAPSSAELKSAWAELWTPFAQFPFRSAVDRSVCVSAILTAIQRPVLPTAPGILITSPVRGATGKSLLSRTLACLAGCDEPATTVAPRTEAEWRKLLYALALRHPPCILFEQVSKPLNSPALAEFLTQEWFTKGKAAPVSTRTLVILNGFDVQVGENLKGCLLRCTLG